MKLGVHIGYWGLGLTRGRAARARPARRSAGYDSVWTAEAYGSDAATILGWLAQADRRRSGSARRSSRCPAARAAMTAMTAATLDQLSGGRMLLGIGSSGPQVAEGWHGQRFARQLQRTREYIEVVRMALARERLEFKGETLELPLPDGPGKALKLTIAPVQERIPIYLAAIGPKNTTLAAEIADGWIPTLFSPEHVGEFRPLLEEGFARPGTARRFDGLRHRPVGQRLRRRRPRRRARRDAPLPRALRRRHGLAREELLQRARPALRLRGRRARGPGPLPGGQEGRGRGRAAGRADRHRDAVRAPTWCASGSASTATPASAR